MKYRLSDRVSVFLCPSGRHRSLLILHFSHTVYSRPCPHRSALSGTFPAVDRTADRGQTMQLPAALPSFLHPVRSGDHLLRPDPAFLQLRQPTQRNTAIRWSDPPSGFCFLYFSAFPPAFSAFPLLPPRSPAEFLIYIRLTRWSRSR